MSEHSMTELTRALRGLPSRRDIVRGLAGASLGLGLLQVSASVEAKKKRKKRKGKKRRNTSQDQNQTLTPPVDTSSPPPPGSPPPPPPPPYAGTCSVQRNRCTVADPVLATCN